MAKLTNNLFGRRFWAVVVAILMIVQLLPVAAIADYVEQTDRNGIVVDTVEVKDGHTITPIGQAPEQPGDSEGVLPVDPIAPNPGDASDGNQGLEPVVPGKTDDGESEGIGAHIADEFDLNRP